MQMHSMQALSEVRSDRDFVEEFTLLIDGFLQQHAEQIDLWSETQGNLVRLSEMAQKLTRLAGDGIGLAVDALHRNLHKLYTLEFEIPTSSSNMPHSSYSLRMLTSILENGAVNHLRSIVPVVENVGELTGAETVAKIREVVAEHPATDHRYYRSTLREHSDIDDLRYYFIQEVTVDPRFDDLIANLQVGLRGPAKMELAQNYWDEMGEGNLLDVHTDLFKLATDALGINETDLGKELSFESILCGNVSVLLASRRDQFYRGAAYFGVMEYLVPARMEHVLHSWRRNKLPEDSIRYHEVHMSLDADHAEGWFKHVIETVVDKDPGCVKDIFEGVQWRLVTSNMYLDMLDKTTSKFNEA